MTRPKLVYRTAGVPRRGVYTADGKAVAILWADNRTVDRERGIMFANSFKLYDALDSIVSVMQNMAENELPAKLREAFEEAERLLEEIDKAKM